MLWLNSVLLGAPHQRVLELKGKQQVKWQHTHGTKASSLHCFPPLSGPQFLYLHIDEVLPAAKGSCLGSHSRPDRDKGEAHTTTLLTPGAWGGPACLLTVRRLEQGRVAGERDTGLQG